MASARRRSSVSDSSRNGPTLPGWRGPRRRPAWPRTAARPGPAPAAPRRPRPLAARPRPPATTARRGRAGWRPATMSWLSSSRLPDRILLTLPLQGGVGPEPHAHRLGPPERGLGLGHARLQARREHPLHVLRFLGEGACAAAPPASSIRRILPGIVGMGMRRGRAWHGLGGAQENRWRAVSTAWWRKDEWRSAKSSAGPRSPPSPSARARR